MCKWGTDRIIHVIRRNNDLFPDGWHPMGVDACIADYVQEMNNRGIITTLCCCSHGHGEPVVFVARESEPLMRQYGYKYFVVTEMYWCTGDECEDIAVTRLHHYPDPSVLARIGVS